MIVLDTNVLSELMRPQPDVSVLQWIDAQPALQLFTTSITQAEILAGIQMLAPGKRRSDLENAALAMFAEDFLNRVLPFDGNAASTYAAITAQRRQRGRPISQFDAQIAAITAAHGARLATRNESDFADCGIAVLNPWHLAP